MGAFVGSGDESGGWSRGAAKRGIREIRGGCLDLLVFQKVGGDGRVSKDSGRTADRGKEMADESEDSSGAPWLSGSLLCQNEGRLAVFRRDSPRKKIAGAKMGVRLLLMVLGENSEEENSGFFFLQREGGRSSLC